MPTLKRFLLSIYVKHDHIHDAISINKTTLENFKKKRIICTPEKVMPDSDAITLML